MNRFHLGLLVITPAALQAIKKAGQTPDYFLQRHSSGDWGLVGDKDAEENELSLLHNFRIFSSYLTNLGQKIYVITEADRKVTTILLPDEY